MPNEFPGHILYEAGQAIGNVGRRLFRRKRKQQAEEALRRWMDLVPMPHIQPGNSGRAMSDDDVIDVTYRVIHDEPENRQE